MEAGLAGLLLIVFIVLVLVYYGMGRNVEVASNMLTRELVDAERTQKVRIAKGHVKEGIEDKDFTKAKAYMKKIDELDI